MNLNFFSSIQNMTTLSFIVGIIGNITSVLIILSPIKTFWRVVRQGSTEEFESLPYICGLLNCTLWVYYGITKPAGGLLIVTINGFGTLVESIYVVLFLIYAPPIMKAKIATLVGILDVGFLLLSVLITQNAFQGAARVEAAGILAAGLCIIMYASPLSAMRTVVMTRSLEYMPFFLSFSLFLNGGVWVFYALLEGDFFIGVSNGVGFVLGTIQIVLYLIYRNAKPSNNILEDGLEEGLHEPLISSLNEVRRRD